MKQTLRDICDITENSNPTFLDRTLKSKVAGLRSRKNFRRFIFLVKSKMSYSSKKGHIVTILFPNITIKMLKANKNALPIDARVRLWCTCPAFQFWGSSYNSTNLKYNLAPNSENRAPVIRDPNNKNLCCKHVNAVVKHIRYDNFIRLFNKFRAAYYRKNKKSNEIENSILLYLYDFLETKEYSHNEIIEIIKGLIETDSIEEYLELNGLII